MYKSIMIYDAQYRDHTMGYFENAFQKEWINVTLPDNDITRQANVDMFCSGRTFFHYWYSMSFRATFLVPAPMIGIVVPIVTNLSSSFSDSSFHSLRYSIDRRRSYYEVKVLVLVIDEGDLTHADWWSEDYVWEAFTDEQKQNIPISIATVNINELEKMPSLIAKHFHLADATVLDATPYSKAQHPYLPNVWFDPKHLGIGDEASLHFVEDCLDGLIPTRIPFRIWIEAMPIESYDRNATYTDLKWRAGRTKNKLGYIIDKWITPIAFPKVVPLSDDLGEEIDHETRGVWRVEPAYHVYLEYEHIAYDGMLGFQNHLAIEAYQHHLASGWFTTIDITSDMTLDEAKSALHEATRRVKRGILD